MVEFVCKQCGGIGKTWPAWIRRGAGITCSPSCRVKYLTGNDRKINGDGYVLLRVVDHPRMLPGRFVYEHTLVAEKALGHFLPEGAEIHHHNRKRGDNRNRNLVVCQDVAYHRLIHARMRVLAAGGNPNIHKICWACRAIKLQIDFSPTRRKKGGALVIGAMCKSCAAQYQRDRRRTECLLPQ